MLDEYDIKATFFVVADVVDPYPGLMESIVSVNSLYNKTDSSLEGVSSHPYYPKKNGLEIGEEKGEKIVEFPWAYWNVFGFKIPTSDGDSEMKIGKMEYELAEEEKEEKKDLLWRVRLKKLKMDFTLSRYKDLCLALLDSGYAPRTVYSYLGGQKNNNNNKLVVLRHDIDRKLGNALRMAELEHELGIQSTYYFRVPYTFKPDIIGKIQALGHEVGYHYEVLSKSTEDYETAIKTFEQELKEFRK